VIFFAKRTPVATPTQFLIEGIDGVGKNKLIDRLLDRLGYHLVIHYERPSSLAFYAGSGRSAAERLFQEASFRTLFQILQHGEVRVIANRAHLGEVVYAPLYRNYPGDYVFELERQFRVADWNHVRPILLTEDFERSRHFVDDGKSLGGARSRPSEHDAFVRAFGRSALQDKRLVCVTDKSSGNFRSIQELADEVLA
jgi:hypothetical protein